MLFAARAIATEDVETLAIRHAAAIDLATVPEELADASTWLGPEIDASAGYRRYVGDLAFPLLTRPRTVLFRKAALVDIGTPARLPDGAVSVEIAWQSATLAPLFPVFAGRLLVRANGLSLAGAYTPPFGEVGRLVDRAALHQVALRTARWFVAGLASRLTAGAVLDEHGQTAACASD